jgi:hypothetical protein
MPKLTNSPGRIRPARDEAVFPTGKAGVVERSHPVGLWLFGGSARG